jgi:quinol monooxygenase YgiN
MAELNNKETSRREFFLSTAAICCPAMDSSGPTNGGREKERMYGLINKIVSAPNRRDNLIAILKESSNDMPGCLSYVIAEDATDENGIWVTEVWDSEASHQASLSLPAVRNAIGRAKPLIAGFNKTAVTKPVAGVPPKNHGAP